jgi:hypothetical protein
LVDIAFHNLRTYSGACPLSSRQKRVLACVPVG